MIEKHTILSTGLRFIQQIALSNLRTTGTWTVKKPKVEGAKRLLPSFVKWYALIN